MAKYVRLGFFKEMTFGRGWRGGGVVRAAPVAY